MALIVSTGQKWAELDKEYVHSDRTSDAKICTEAGQGGHISSRKRIFIYFYI